MYMKSSKKKGLALIICMSILFGLSSLAVSFVKMTSMNRRATVNFSQIMQAKMVAQAGIDYAIARIASGYEREKFFEEWQFAKADPDGVNEALFNAGLFAEDDVGSGFDVEDVQEILDSDLDADTNQPSFRTRIAGRNVSGSIGSDNHTFTLKVIDSSSQINLNSNMTFLPDVLNNLSKAVAMRSPYINERGNDGIGPLKGLGEIIVANRPVEGYTDESQLIGLSDGVSIITAEDLAYIEDFITTFPSRKKMEKNPLFSNIAFSNLGDEKDYKNELRSPININTAPWPVLFAIFSNLRAADMSNEPAKQVLRLTNRIKFLEERINILQLANQDSPKNGGLIPLVGNLVGSLLQPLLRILANLNEQLNIANLQLDKFNDILKQQGEEPIFFAITEQEAIILANRIASHRRLKPFASFQDFEDFLKQIENLAIFESDPLQKIALLIANGKNSLSLDRLNPDHADYSLINKSELLFNTTELTFFPLGNFEITSLAEIFNDSGDLVTSSKYFTQVNIFDVASENTQRDFLTNQQQNFNEKLQDNAFVNGNNLQKASPAQDASSLFTGSVSGIGGNLLTGYAKIDEPKNTGGNYLFRADFNGNLDADEGNPQQAHGTKKDAIDQGGLALPNEENGGGTFADLVVDGIILNSQDDNVEDSLFFISRPNENAAIDDPAVDGNFPALANGADIANLDGNVNEGSLMFWLKINENWDSEVWRTLFFVNTSFKVKNEETGEEYIMGIQREIQARVQKEAQGTLQRKLAIQVRNKFFCLVNGEPTKPPANFMPYSNTDFGRKIELDATQNTAVNAQEFYHIALRWRNGTSMENFPKNNPLGINDQNVSIAVSGNFYDKNNKETQSHIAFDEGLPFEEANNNINRISFDNLNKDEDFAPLDDRFVALNRFFIGGAGRTLSPEATVDDIRITKNTDWVNQPEFRPSRHPIPQNSEPFNIAKFIGQFEIENGVRALFSVPTVLTPKSQNQVYSVDYTFDKDTLNYIANFQVQQNSPKPVNLSAILLSTDLFYFDKPIFDKYIEK